jgi:hypothetical protein
MKRFDLFILDLIVILFIFDFTVLAGVISTAYAISFATNEILGGKK